MYPNPDVPGFYYDKLNRPWAVVKEVRGRPLVFVWAQPEAYPDPGTLTRLFRMSPQQAKVAQLLIHRRTNVEIASILNITSHTAKRHVEAVLVRMGVCSRFEVEAAFHRSIGA